MIASVVVKQYQRIWVNHLHNVAGTKQSITQLIIYTIQNIVCYVFMVQLYVIYGWLTQDHKNSIADTLELV